MGFFFLFTFLFCLFPLIYFILRPIARGNLPPGPMPYPVVGNLLQMGPKPHARMAHLSQIHGPLMSLRFGAQLVIVAASPSAAFEVLHTHDRVLSGRYLILGIRSKSYSDYSLAWQEECNEEWRKLRKICRMKLFGLKMMDAHAHLRELKVKTMVEFLKGKEGEEIKIGEVLFGTVFNVLGNLIFSKDAFDIKGSGGRAADLKACICKMFELASCTNIADYYPILSGLDLFGQRRAFEKLRNQMFESWKDVIKERRMCHQEASSELDFLDILISAGFEDHQINILFLEIISAACDTTASTVEWAMAELIKNNSATEKLLLELKSHIPLGPIKETHLPNLPYLQSCIKETLRLHPPTPLLLPRRALETCSIQGYTVPKDCQVMVNVWAVGRDPGSWEQPLRFWPERFLSSAVDYRGTHFQLLPFGGGRRICPGIPLVEKLVPLMVASLVKEFQWHLPDGMQPEMLSMEEKFGLTLQKDPPLLLVPKSRSA